jgi:hypothetical protein
MNAARIAYNANVSRLRLLAALSHGYCSGCGNQITAAPEFARNEH